MFYSKIYLNREPKIPTLLSILLIVSVIYITGRFLLTSSVPTRAQKGNVIKKDLINLYPNQATLTWVSYEEEQGYVIYGTSASSLKNTASDIKDSLNKKGKYKNHSVTLKNLKSNTHYFAIIISGNKLVYDTNDKPFEFTTPKENVLGETTIRNVKFDIVDFIYPVPDAIITATIPLIKGVALPNSNVLINIKGININRNYSIKADNKGLWNLSSITELNPGKYSLILSSTDKEGKKIEKQRSFTIAKSGEQVLGESTPSAITTTPTATPTIESTQTPTQAVAPPSPTIPVSGNSAMYMWVASIAFIILGFSLIIFSSI